MLGNNPNLLCEVRNRFSHVSTCPISGERTFFENAGGALTLKSVVKTSSEYSAIPDNQGRDNVTSRHLSSVIEKAQSDARTFFNAPSGQFFVGESGTELLFRLISVAILDMAEGGTVLGSTLEHPASRSATRRWAGIAGKEVVMVAHDNVSGTVTAQAYASAISPQTQVATILHTSPVTGMSVDVAAISRAIRAVAPDCIIIVDGIQHAAHGCLDIESYGVDGYVISPYKAFSRHGYGIAWTSVRLSKLDHNMLDGGPETQWELGTRDTGAYATFSDVVEYFDWLGSQLTESKDRRKRLVEAGKAIHAHEKDLTDAMLHGHANFVGLASLPRVTIIGGIDNPNREGLVAFTVADKPASEIVTELNAVGIRTHVRKADHYSSNILDPLGLDACVRVSMCHYNTEQEVAKFLGAIRQIIGT